MPLIWRQPCLRDTCSAVMQMPTRYEEEMRKVHSVDYVEIEWVMIDIDLEQRDEIDFDYDYD